MEITEGSSISPRLPSIETGGEKNIRKTAGKKRKEEECRNAGTTTVIKRSTKKQNQADLLKSIKEIIESSL